MLMMSDAVQVWTALVVRPLQELCWLMMLFVAACTSSTLLYGIRSQSLMVANHGDVPREGAGSGLPGGGVMMVF